MATRRTLGVRVFPTRCVRLWIRVDVLVPGVRVRLVTLMVRLRRGTTDRVKMILVPVEAEMSVDALSGVVVRLGLL